MAWAIDHKMGCGFPARGSFPCLMRNGTRSDTPLANDRTMRIPHITMRYFGFTALVALGLVACQSGPSESEQAALAENARLKSEVTNRDSLISDMSRSFGEIEDNLAMIEDREKLLPVGEASLTVDQRQRIMRDIQLMNSLMQESRDRVAELAAKLDKSKVESGSLRKKLKALDTELTAAIVPSP